MEPPQNHGRTSITLTEPLQNPHRALVESSQNHCWTSQMFLMGIHKDLHNIPKLFSKLDSHKKDRRIT